MKYILSLSLFLLALTLQSQDMKSLVIGDKAPMTDHKMPSTGDKELSLTELKGDKGLLVIFSCNTCPFVVGNGTKSEGWEGRYNGIHDLAMKNNIGMVLVNPNEAKREKGDGLKDMVEHSKELGYTSPYVMDKGHVLADAFGAMRTPHIYLFDADMKLVYMGAIDDNVNHAGQVKEHYLNDALKAVGTDKKVRVSETPAQGCSIKRI